MGRKMEDLTGQRFGLLTVLGFDRRESCRYYWKCMCDCGVYTTVNASNLRSEVTKSCGCLRKITFGKDRNKISMKGQRYSRLLVIDESSKRMGKKGVYWECRCDCGNIITASRPNLIEGSVKSCGCLMQELIDNIMTFEGTNISAIRSQKPYKNNKSGIKGISWCNQHKKWQAVITFKNKRYHLGFRENIADVAAIRKQAEEKLFGEFLEWYDKEFPKLGIKDVSIK